MVLARCRSWSARRFINRLVLVWIKALLFLQNLETMLSLRRFCAVLTSEIGRGIQAVTFNECVQPLQYWTSGNEG